MSKLYLFRISCALVVLGLAAPLGAIDAPAASVQIAGGAVTFQPLVEYGRATLRIGGPAGGSRELRFGVGEPIAWAPGIDGAADGIYRYELTLGPARSDGRRRGGRTRGAALPVISGSFAVRSGLAVVAGDDGGRSAAGPQTEGSDLHVAGDLTVASGACIGCSPGTPVPTGAVALDGATSDFELIVDSGTAFQIEKIGDSVPGLYIDGTGNVGMGTAVPTDLGTGERGHLHLLGGDTPAIRLDQDTSGGFDAWTWDILANEGEWAVQDVTGGDVIPFTIEAGSPDASIAVSTTTGDVGLGILEPTAALHVFREDGTARLLVDDDLSPAAGRELLRLSNFGPPQFRFEDSNTGIVWAFAQQVGGLVFNRLGTGGNELFLQGNGRLKIGPGTDVVFDLEPDGDLTISGTFTSEAGPLLQGSSRELKHGFVPVDAGEVLDKVVELPLSSWRYSAKPDGGRHIGPVAEDFHAAFGLGADDKTLAPADAAGVALAAIQGLADRLEAVEAENAALRAELEALRAAND